MQLLKKTKRIQIFAIGVFIALFFLTLFSFYTYTKHVYPLQYAQEIQEDQRIKITGAVVDQEIPTSSSEKQIGVYTLYPSFSFPEPFSLSKEYDTLQKQIRIFHQDVETCREEDSERSLEDCFSLTLEKAAYDSWHIEEDCETEEEKIFYDFTELFARCLQSNDDDCVCSSSFSSSAGEYSFTFVAEENQVLVTFQETSLDMLFPSLLLMVGETPLSFETYTLHVDDSGTIGWFSSLQPSDTLYLYKQDDHTLFVEDQTTFSTFSTTRDACAVPEKATYKFCVQSDQTVSGYDASLQSTITQPMVYVFALAFP